MPGFFSHGRGKNRRTASALHSQTWPSSYQVSLFETTRQEASKHRSSRPRAKLLPSFHSASPLAKRRAHLHEGLPALVRVGMLTHSKSLSTLPASSAHICLYVAFILQTASTTALSSGDYVSTSRTDISKNPALTIYRSLDRSTGEQPRIH